MVMLPVYLRKKLLLVIKQAVTLRLMARVYLDWDRREHLQKALNAVGK